MRHSLVCCAFLVGLAACESGGTNPAPQDLTAAETAATAKEAAGYPCKLCTCKGFQSDPNDEKLCIGPRPPQGRCQHSYLNHPKQKSSLTVNPSVSPGGPAPFLCGGCGREIAKCSGGPTGKKCVWCSSPGGHCKCPLCGKEHYEISHTHF
jgi:hypothetical protein